MTPAIETRALQKRFGTHAVLDGVDLRVENGEVFALLGPNGAGKTTLVNILTTLTRPDGGSAQVAGHDVARDAVAVTQCIALTGQAAAVDEVLTARENLVMFGRLSGLSRTSAALRAEELLSRFDLADASDRRVGAFSGGMRRRLDLALSFVVQPQVLFLDEPTTGLDARSRRELWHIIAALAETGTTVFLTTQYLEEADQLADRIAVLHDGRIAALGTSDELKARIGGGSVQLRDAAGALLRELPTDGSVSSVRRAIDELDAAGLDGEIAIHRPTLDDVFLALTDRPRHKEDA
ncbi:ATP-binding cassette domain-containing protein [Microbacterium karelineae]|uniref:ATP-binding cassette domain-containing protein n=1 Tax=Microbacterium karelineae TaxID=2654283 RepID=UPI003F67ACB6